MANNGGGTVPRIEKSEHIGPDDTGDNIMAKRVAAYGFGTDSNWARNPISFIDKPFDYIQCTNADGNGNYQTWNFRSGGSSGTIVRTLSVTYDANSNITSLGRS